MQDGSTHDISGPGIPSSNTGSEPGGDDAMGVVIARTEVIGLGGSDETVVTLQLAARWAEKYGPDQDDTLEDALRRFRRAYNYVNAVTKLVEPDEG
jgi:hypothetical protein